MTPIKTEVEAKQPEATPELPKLRFQPIKPRGGSPNAASDEVIRGRGRNPDCYEDEPMPKSDGVNPLQIQQCYVVLEQVEKTGKTPIPLEWFRDEALLHSYKFDWLESPEFRQRVIDKSIEAGALEASTMPRAEGGPDVTVISTVKFEPPKDGKRYHPITVHGEPVSVTLIRDRGGY